jgi:hypothetical protein
VFFRGYSFNLPALEFGVPRLRGSRPAKGGSSK